MQEHKDLQFYFIEDQDYPNAELKDFKKYLYDNYYLVNNLIIAKDIKNKDEALLKLIDCNLTENKNCEKLYIVCGGPLSLYLLKELHYLSYDGIITFDCSPLTTIPMIDFSCFTKEAGKNVNKKDWKTYFNVLPDSYNYLKNYLGAYLRLRKQDNIQSLFQINKNKDKYQICLYHKASEDENNVLTTKGKFNDIDTKENLFDTIVSKL